MKKKKTNEKKSKNSSLSLGQVGEEELIRLIRSRMAPVYSANIIKGIGDDTAVLKSPRGALLATVDILVEGVHFRREFSTFEDVGYKALAVNLSDIASMGGKPLYALISLALPPQEPSSTLKRLYHGLKTAAREFEVNIVGGNLSAHKGGVIIDVTLLGEASPGEILYRGGAKEGDVLMVTGFLGQAALGLLALKRGWGKSQGAALLVKAHRRPRPLLREGRWLARQGGIHAMIDLSDGLAKDLGHLCQESKLGALIYEEKIPRSREAQKLAKKLKVDLLPLTLGGGEDYQLLMAVDPARANTLEKNWKRRFALPLTNIGKMVKPSSGIGMADSGGKIKKLKGGYRHF